MFEVGILGIIMLLPIVALFFEGYNRKGIKQGFLNVFYFGIISTIVLSLSKHFGLDFIILIPFLFILFFLLKYLKKK